ncbi:hypothetical protein PPTG_23513 [Phytophthora nicotianae INRA-310]|uniref:Uncharacterized protein n=1 Tax=Phytophthora nicotianae (strain INRA-310) TaxID=761204 RepID=W2PYX1_PHYN3|nr:hypothetical protein PPTG_23513 [Phytophthora nicotianae INRA-310]ETN05454.1 hypothetical protein PPTG_23513 [Phytophthora nicotianae INRA-310]
MLIGSGDGHYNDDVGDNENMVAVKHDLAHPSVSGERVALSVFRGKEVCGVKPVGLKSFDQTQTLVSRSLPQLSTVIAEQETGNEAAEMLEGVSSLRTT